ncbi:MAG: lamin tail domain-containing protein, partial [Bacteroidaceae bacterium]|nr:lamin tail domain-containing protein [Bacteroidaceae bacterium]
MKKIYFLLLAIIFAHSLHAEEQGIIINEVMPANVSYMLDATFNYNGWVELYNPTGKEFNLAGYSFTDDYSQPQKFVLPK